VERVGQQLIEPHVCSDDSSFKLVPILLQIAFFFPFIQIEFAEFRHHFGGRRDKLIECPE